MLHTFWLNFSEHLSDQKSAHALNRTVQQLPALFRECFWLWNIKQEIVATLYASFYC
jgi:hypothetical protein